MKVKLIKGNSMSTENIKKFEDEINSFLFQNDIVVKDIKLLGHDYHSMCIAMIMYTEAH